MTEFAKIPNLHITGQLKCAENAFATKQTVESLLKLDTLKRFPQDLSQLRLYDAYGMPLPGNGELESGVIQANYYWNPNSADDSFFVAGRAYRVLGITACIEVAGTDGGAVTAAIKKAASGTDIASGTALHSSTIDLKGTVNTNQTPTLSVTSTDLDIAAGTRIGIDLTGTLTDARGVVSVLLAPAPSADDLRFVGGAFGTAPQMVQTGNLKAAGARTLYARGRGRVPERYVNGESFQIILPAGMVTTVADVTATIDLAAYKPDNLGGISSDLCATDAQSINSLTFAEKTFVITPTDLDPGDELDYRIAIAVNDAATATNVIGALAAIIFACDIQG